ncbi:hypothetical protein Aspvir_004117 [Aspergillus viridinutans]|uniref:Uncharacterized protein n=1 Tax=Aspergillus viridinutans TaxID=75553 RepID=A0A9P3F041_ASPVI|nr:uncharacterized protein Aspvir_004117 [Aspergillus viridinutans]GIK00102.1 hypothetical protein Aspvir_004117 [Aspergillus viridinutans]
MATTPVVCVPMKIDAFVLNPSLCNELPKSTIAPITQPNYTFLRLEPEYDYLQPDILPHVDLHAAGKVSTNSRLTDLGTGHTRDNRIGVYLHWILPRVYRSGTATTGTDAEGKPVSHEAEDMRRAASGYPQGGSVDPDKQAVVYRSAPNRWLIIRRLHMDTVLPPEAKARVSPFHAFLVESDRLMNIDDLGSGVDLEVDVSPFIQGSLDDLEGQAEIFIGYKVDDALKPTPWKEDKLPKRVPVSVLNSSNQLFPDYVPHNGNVFSMVDDFTYAPDANHPQAPRKKLSSATASYQVFGWHSDANIADDPFHIVVDPTLPAASITHATRMKGCKFRFDSTVKENPDVTDWLNQPDSTRVICHGSMYGVKFSSTDFRGESPKVKIPADDLADSFSKNVPVTIGTSPLDTVLSFMRANVDTATESNEKRTLDDIKALQSILLKGEESADGQYEAQDMLSAHNFAPAKDSGYHWQLVGENSQGRPTEPTGEQLTSLNRLNVYQEALDLTLRDLRLERWKLWAMWWEYHTVLPSIDPHVIQALKAKHQKQADAVQGLIDSAFGKPGGPVGLQKQIDDMASQLPCQKCSRDRFFTLRDPTLLVSGISSPWPADFLDDLVIRTHPQVAAPDTMPSDAVGDWKSYAPFVKAVRDAAILPTAPMQEAVERLMLEFFQLHPSDPGESSSPSVPSGKVAPLYNDHADGKKGPRDQWLDTQPWFPLFLEWEAHYYHIPMENWRFENVPALDVGATRTRYGIVPDKRLSDPAVYDARNMRVVSGRVLILPQPSFSLKALIKQVLLSTPPSVLKQAIPDDKERNGLPDAVDGLQFMSAPLDGFRTHLLTQAEGTHVKPGRRVPGQQIVALPGAISDGMFTSTAVALMDTETGTTPYAGQVTFLDQTHSPMKPVTHGQFMFTKLNVIDKFGQAVSAIDPRSSVAPPAFSPVLSEYYQPQLWKTTTEANVIFPSETRTDCQFAQMPPSINQDARLNTAFLIRDEPTAAVPDPPFRPAAEWESPIWGWLVFNYVEEGVQIFLPDGTFYREVRVGGVNGATALPKWAPFDQPSSVGSTSQLNSFAESLRNASTLHDFLASIGSGLDAVPEAPTDYAQYMAAITGKPLALVNIGVSLELATDPLENQATTNTTPPEKELLAYQFSVKLGDADRVYDGLVGFYDAAGNTFNSHDETWSGPAPGFEADFSTLYTYFPSGPSTARIDDATTPRWLTLSPYKLPNTLDPAAMHGQRMGAMKVVTAITDPFTAIHAYSGILPIASLQLPPWSVQLALQRMTTFFSLGPLVITSPSLHDSYRTARKLDQSAPPVPQSQIPAGSHGTAPPGTGIPIPAIQSADWRWLQPFFVDDRAGDDGHGKGKRETEWNGVGIEALDGKARLEGGPYTAVEGYLQMMKAMNIDGKK